MRPYGRNRYTVVGLVEGLNQAVGVTGGFDYHEIENPGDSFWFRLRSLRRNDVNIIEAYDRYVDDVRVQLYDSGGNELSQNGRLLTHAVQTKKGRILSSAILYFIPDANGTYYLEVTSDSDDTGRIEVKYDVKTTSREDSGGTDCPDSPAGTRSCRIVPADFVGSDSQTSATGHFRDGHNSQGVKDVDRWDFYFRAGQRYEVCVRSTGRGHFVMHSHSSELFAATYNAGGSSGQKICDHFGPADRPAWVHTRIYSRQGKGGRNVNPPATGSYRISICAWNC